MRIISKENDYFDYVGKIYDPSRSDNLVFDRNAKMETTVVTTREIKDNSAGIHDWLKNFHLLSRYAKGTGRRFNAYVFAFAGTLYPCLEERDGFSYEITMCFNFDKFNNQKVNGKGIFGSWVFNSERLLKEYTIPFETETTDIRFASKLWKINFDRTGVKLTSDHDSFDLAKDFDLHSILSPEQAFQEFSMFWVDAMNIEKETHSTDKEKVQQKGFDQKFSFRSNHPSNN